MYYVDANEFMNGVVGIILATGATLFIAAAAASLLGARRSRAMSYIYMLCVIFLVFGAVVALLGFRGRSSRDEPLHFLLDMKYQPKYSAQGKSGFFSDNRSMRLPPEHTLPFDGTDFSADAGYHTVPKADFLKGDIRYYRGIAGPAAKEARDGILMPKDPTWKSGQLTETYYVGRVPDRAVDEAGGWRPLFKRGKHQFNTHCAACHGASGRGGTGTEAHGAMGAYGLSVAPADLTTAAAQAQPDGQLFNTIGHGKGQMPGYGHQVSIQDRWAIAAYIRVLQYARK
jgi:mono/diheme cytochrome c family protein